MIVVGHSSGDVVVATGPCGLDRCTVLEDVKATVEFYRRVSVGLRYGPCLSYGVFDAVKRYVIMCVGAAQVPDEVAHVEVKEEEESSRVEAMSSVNIVRMVGSRAHGS